MAIKVFDRRRQQYFEEKVLGGGFVDWGYETKFGLAVTTSAFTQKFVTRLMGYLQKRRSSARRVLPFVKNYGIALEEFQVPAGGYQSFNDFFIRPLKPGARPFQTDARELGAPAEGRLSVFPIQGGEHSLTIKGQNYPVSRLLAETHRSAEFQNGHAWVFRLCPVDYHRFHFPDAGRATASHRIGGALHSVNPAAQRAIPDVFLQNERQACLLESENFGPLLVVEVGAMCVGKIVQTYAAESRVERGQEKGYFEFGGSTLILLTRADRVQPDADLLIKTAEGMECLVRVGERVGRAI